MALGMEMANRMLALMIEGIKESKEKFYKLSYGSQLRLIIMMMVTDTDGTNDAVAEEFTNKLIEQRGISVLEDLEIVLAAKKK